MKKGDPPQIIFLQGECILWKKNESNARVGGAHPDNPIQLARVKKGLIQERAAEALSCGVRTLQRYEAGETEPKKKILDKMQSVYDCEIGDLF